MSSSVAESAMQGTPALHPEGRRTGLFQSVITAGQALGKQALYFGCWHGAGHYLHGPGGRSIRKERDFPDLYWSDGLMDTGLLDNGRHPDVYDGKVFWTCGGAKALWYAFFWWDRSVDRRGNSNSGFYVRGFGWPEAQAAFDYACAEFPKVVSRQAHPLVLQEPSPTKPPEG